MKNRIVDSTWLGRGRHVLLEQVLTCQTTSKTLLLPPNPNNSLSRLFINTYARSFARSIVRYTFACSLARPTWLLIYLSTHSNIRLSLARSFTCTWGSLHVARSSSSSVFTLYSFSILLSHLLFTLLYVCALVCIAVCVCVDTLKSGPSPLPTPRRTSRCSHSGCLAVPRREAQLGPHLANETAWVSVRGTQYSYWRPVPWTIAVVDCCHRVVVSSPNRVGFYHALLLINVCG